MASGPLDLGQVAAGSGSLASSLWRLNFLRMVLQAAWDTAVLDGAELRASEEAGVAVARNLLGQVRSRGQVARGAGSVAGRK